MGERTGVNWCHHTFNPVWGCVQISPACDFCYAKDWDGGEHWGPHAPLREFGDAHWNEPLRWNRAAAKAGVHRAVFCASMADVFDKRWPEHVRPRLWQTIKATPNLDWMLLTKRPENIPDRLPADWGDGWPNVLFGVTVESKEYLGRVSKVLDAAGENGRCFISYEPALGRLGRISDVWHAGDRPRIVGLICGGESGKNARPMHPDNVRDARDRCAAVGIKFHFKQWGDWLPERQSSDPSLYANTGPAHNFGDVLSYRVGKKRSGHLLDGRAYLAFPEAALS